MEMAHTLTGFQNITEASLWTDVFFSQGIFDSISVPKIVANSPPNSFHSFLL